MASDVVCGAEDGWLEATFRIDSFEAATIDLLGLSPHVEVLAPPRLRTDVSERLEAAAALGRAGEFVARVRTARDRLAPTQIGDDGRLMEWARPFGEAEPGHRHVSHLFGLHPGRQFTPEASPERVVAARRSLEYRMEHGGGHTGWSRAADAAARPMYSPIRPARRLPAVGSEDTVVTRRFASNEAPPSNDWAT